MMIKLILEHIKHIEHGFKHIIEAGDKILEDKNEDHLGLAITFVDDSNYQVRMLGTYILGQLSTNLPKALELLENKVSQDPNWHVQEMLAKAFDNYCCVLGYEPSLPKIKSWLCNPNPNVKRAVIEGLRIWTGRPYFKEYPKIAIDLISLYRSEESEYLRRSVGNALRDIRKKHPDEVNASLLNWNLKDKNTLFTYELVIGKK